MVLKHMKKEDKLKIILTGGHLSPLVAVVGKLEESADVVIIGRKYTFEADKTESLEYKTFQEKHIPFYNLPNSRLQRKITRYTIPSLVRLPYSLTTALSILKKEKPDVVLAFGGYIGLSVAVAASLLHIPIVLHEQTQKAGLANRIIGRFAQKVCISYESSRPFFKKNKTVLTGNPLRRDILHVDQKLDIKTTLPVLTVMGGSSGSHRINMYIKDILPLLLEKFSVIHQVGDAQEFKDYDMLLEYKNSIEKKMQENYTVLKFIDSKYMGWVYKNTDIFVSRSGANTVQELLSLSKKAVLVPLAYAAAGEQLDNAKLYAESGLGVYIEEKDISSQKLYNEILAVFEKHVSKNTVDVRNTSVDQICSIVVSAAHEKTVI